jgi:uncharacterized protein YecE (DUF72 family)
MRVRVGTSGYSYAPWRGSFYPEALAPEEWLAFYAARFASVEINSTFYRLPRRELLARWAEEVRANAEFVFVLKASQRITHRKRLVGAESELAYLLGNVDALGPALGPLLFQLPPFVRRDTERLRGFLKLVPAPRRAAFEFRHASWDGDDVRAALREAGAALVVSDADDAPFEGALPDTADWGYLQLRRSHYDDAALRAWAERILARPWREAFVFFKHEDDGPQGPRDAARFIELLQTMRA